MLTSVAAAHRFPMSPQLRQILVHAKRLNQAEQLLLITHMVNHTLPLADDRAESIVDEMPIIDAIDPIPPIPAAPPLPIDDPQYAEFRHELALYQQDLPQG
jgi:hypothetical protein